MRIVSEDLLVSHLPISPGAGYEVVAKINTGPVSKGEEFLVIGESHGNPQQSQGQEECAWVTGIAVYDPQGNLYQVPCNYGGEDREHARKDRDTRVGVVTIDDDMPNLEVRLRMRAVNLQAGGTFDLTWARLEAWFPGKAAPPPVPDPVPSTLLSFRNRWESPQDASEYVSQAILLGDEFPERKLIAAVGAKKDAAGRTILSVEAEFDGNWIALQKLAGDTNTENGSDIVEFWGCEFPLGSETRIKMVCSGTMQRAGGVVYTKSGSLIPTFVASDKTLSNNTLSINADMAGEVMGFVTGRYIYDWGSLTPDFEPTNIEGGYGQSGISLSIEQPTVISVSQPDALGNPVLLLAGWPS